MVERLLKDLKAQLRLKDAKINELTQMKCDAEIGKDEVRMSTSMQTGSVENLIFTVSVGVQEIEQKSEKSSVLLIQERELSWYEEQLKEANEKLKALQSTYESELLAKERQMEELLREKESKENQTKRDTSRNKWQKQLKEKDMTIKRLNEALEVLRQQQVSNSKDRTTNKFLTSGFQRINALLNAGAVHRRTRFHRDPCQMQKHFALGSLKERRKSVSFRIRSERQMIN